jgi:SAM-dependent methyltransferase
VVDLAAGTGKLTRLLVRRFARVVAAEPDDALRALIPAGEAVAGSAERIPLYDASVVGVFCAEAFHWFDAPLAVAEIARVLRPGGSLVICFNVPAGATEPPWPEGARDLIRRRRPDDGPLGGRHLIEEGTWREPFAVEPFEPLRFEKVEHEHVQDTEGEIAHLLSISGLAVLPAEEREALREELRAMLPATTWRMPLLTEIWSTRRLAG